MNESFFNIPNDDAKTTHRFVYLEDCGHSIESKTMDDWMNSCFGDDPSMNHWSLNKSVELPKCPKCNTPIRRNLRYSEYVNTQLAIVEKICYLKEIFSQQNT